MIPFPRHVLGDEHHIWGNYPLHYLDGYYRYAFEAVEVIVKAGDRHEEMNLLRCLRSKWEEVLYVDSSMLKWLDLARIDIKNQGEGNDVKIKVAEGERCNMYQADWFSYNGAGYVLETYDRHTVLDMECRGAGKLLIRLQGVDRRASGGDRLPLWVDYTRLTVNGEEILHKRQSLWHDKPFAYTCQVTDGERVRVEISWEPHGYKGEELSGLISLWNAPAKPVPAPLASPPQKVAGEEAYIPDILWAQVYHDTIIGSKWLLDKSISPGGLRGWAVGYNFLYVLYRVLEEMKPGCILELGLGQSTKLTSQYARYYGAEHLVVEHDREWEEFFRNSFSLPANTCVMHRNLTEKEHKGQKYFAYEDFDEAVGSLFSSCNLIWVDGPFGNRSEYSRRDVVAHLPEILAEDFVIMIDDCGREGETNLLMEIKGILEEYRIEYATGLYKGAGTCHVGIVADKGHKFFVSM